MNTPSSRVDLIRITASLACIAILVVGSLWVVHPFLLPAVWAGMVTIATWPLLLWLQNLFWGRRFPAVLILTLCWLFLFIFPIAIAINSVVDNREVLMAWASASKQWTVPTLEGLNSIPMIGRRLYKGWQQILADGGSTLLSRLQPYIGQSITWLIGQLGQIGIFVVHSMLMIVFTTLFYFKGEAIASAMRHFAFRLSQERGVSAVVLAAQSIRAVALGVIVTALVQSILGGIGLAVAGVNYATLLSILMFICCVAQLGPLPVLLSCVAYLYWGADQGLASVLLLLWSLAVATLDNTVRPILIRRGANLPLMLIFGGVIGGLLALGMLGLFLGPVILAVTWTLTAAWVNEVALPEDDEPPVAAPAADNEATKPET